MQLKLIVLTKFHSWRFMISAQKRLSVVKLPTENRCLVTNTAKIVRSTGREAKK